MSTKTEEKFDLTLGWGESRCLKKPERSNKIFGADSKPESWGLLLGQCGLREVLSFVKSRVGKSKKGPNSGTGNAVYI